MNTKPLTQKELAWLDQMQNLLNKCPSNRIAFYTVGDSFLGLHDAGREAEIGQYIENNGCEWGSAAKYTGADFNGYVLNFPNCVHSTSG